MKRLLLLLLITTWGMLGARAYNDHRGHNLDSLERAVARWTPDAVDGAGVEELIQLNRAYRDLMLGYQQLNQEKFLFYARKALQISRREGWEAANADALRYIGQYFYAHEQQDSALVYFCEALASVDKMAAGATSPTQPEGYSESDIDDSRSALYGAIGNLYNMMGDIPMAMEYYGKAGDIFEKYGWNESSSILYYNIGETWVDEGEYRKAREAYDKSMTFAESSGDTLMIVNVWKGYGRLYAEQGRNIKALKYLRKAEKYYTAHPGEEEAFRTENLNYMQEVLSRQKKQLLLLTLILTGIVLSGGGIILRRRKVKAAEKGMIANPAPAVKSSKSAPELSEREREILDLLSKGYTAPDIAKAMNLSNETIRWYRKRLISKFDVSNTAELISVAKDMGLL